MALSEPQPAELALVSNPKSRWLYGLIALGLLLFTGLVIGALAVIIQGNYRLEDSNRTLTEIANQNRINGQINRQTLDRLVDCTDAAGECTALSETRRGLAVLCIVDTLIAQDEGRPLPPCYAQLREALDP